MKFSLFYLWILCLALGGRSTGVRRRHPVIYIPGDGGSTLEAKLDKPQVHPLSDSPSRISLDEGPISFKVRRSVHPTEARVHPSHASTVLFVPNLT